MAAFGIFNYILAILKSKGYSIDSDTRVIGNWIIVVAFLCTLTVLSAVLVKNPGAILTHLHWVWVMIIGILAFIALVVVGIIMVSIDNARLGFSLIVSGACTLALMITGLCLCKNVEYYEISSARGFNLLDNLPDKNGAYVIHITDDIDFGGRTIDGSFGDEDESFYIYGNGHTISGIRYEAELKESVDFIEGEGTITDLKLKDCEYYLKPNRYDKEAHRGYSVSFNLLGDFELTNIEIDAVVYKLPTDEMGALYENESTVGRIYPYFPTEEEIAEDPSWYKDEYFTALLQGNNKINVVIKEGEE